MTDRKPGSEPVSGGARRIGPRPLSLHLALGGSTWLSGAMALPAALGGHLPWHPSLEDKAEELTRRLKATNPRALQTALNDEATGRIGQALAGIDAYRKHPYRRTLETPGIIAAAGTSRLLDYGWKHGQNNRSEVILCVPSLINPAYILDLTAESSLMRHLAGEGFCPLLVDWGAPAEIERTFGLDDYIQKHLTSLLNAAVARAGGPVHLMGYCMGGNLALALAQKNPDLVRSLMLLATPWDFHVASVAHLRAVSTMMTGVVTAFEHLGEIPVDFVQLFFTSLDPTLNDRKFRRFAALDQTSKAARMFVAIEDWVNDGAPLAVKVAHECLHGWYRDNSPAKGLWKIGGETIQPETIDIPALVVIPSADRIVPPASARALADILPKADIIQARAGHVAMIAQPSSWENLAGPLAEWLRKTGKKG